MFDIYSKTTKDAKKQENLLIMNRKTNQNQPRTELLELAQENIRIVMPTFYTFKKLRYKKDKSNFSR